MEGDGTWLMSNAMQDTIDAGDFRKRSHKYHKRFRAQYFHGLLKSGNSKGYRTRNALLGTCRSYRLLALRAWTVDVSKIPMRDGERLYPAVKDGYRFQVRLHENVADLILDTLHRYLETLGKHL